MNSQNDGSLGCLVPTGERGNESNQQLTFIDQTVDPRKQLTGRGILRIVEVLLEGREVRRFVAALGQPLAKEPVVGLLQFRIGPFEDKTGAGSARYLADLQGLVIPWQLRFLRQGHTGESVQLLHFHTLGIIVVEADGTG